MKNIIKGKEGFTLIEILVVIGIIAILAAVVLIAINPARQFAQAHNSQRVSNVNAILNAVGQNMADNKGVFTCAAGAVPNSATGIKETGGYDLRPCIVSTYMAEIPVDPTTGSNTCTTQACTAGTDTYDTGYTIEKDAASGRITIKAPAAELSQTISITR